MKSVFISHSSSDKELVEAVVDALERDGISVWVAPRDIPAGSNYGASIVKGIRECSVLLLIFSKDSNKSTAVFREVQKAYEEKKEIIPLRVDDVSISDDLGFYLSGLHWLDVARNQMGFDNLSKEIKQVLQSPVEEIHETLPHTTKSELSIKFPFRKNRNKVLIATGFAFFSLLTMVFVIIMLRPPPIPEPPLIPDEDAAQVIEFPPQAEQATDVAHEAELQQLSWKEIFEKAQEYAEVSSGNILQFEVWQYSVSEDEITWAVAIDEVFLGGTINRLFTIADNGIIKDYSEQLVFWEVQLPDTLLAWNESLEVVIEHPDISRTRITHIIMRKWGHENYRYLPLLNVQARGIFFGEKVSWHFDFDRQSGELLDLWVNKITLDDLLLGGDLTADAPSFIIPDSNTRLIAQSELFDISIHNLRIARNEIYARHGMRFSSRELQEHFNAMYWYVPRLELGITPILSYIEQRNVATLRAEEVSR